MPTEMQILFISARCVAWKGTLTWGEVSACRHAIPPAGNQWHSTTGVYKIGYSLFPMSRVSGSRLAGAERIPRDILASRDFLPNAATRGMALGIGNARGR